MPTVLLEQCPYVGPRPFERSEKRYLGRETEASQLLSYITSQRAFLVYAQSGAGKTSLINAGVIPLLEREHFEVLPVARVRHLGRGDVSAAKNIFVFSAIMSWTSSGIEPRSLFDKTLAESLARPVIDDTLPRVVIFDQFEELFTAHLERWQERRGFFEQVCDALNADPLLRVVFVMREDYIAELNPYLSIIPGKLRARFRLEQLREKAAIDSVTKPLLGTPWHFAKGVAEKLVHDLMEVRFERSGEEDFHVKAEFVELVQLQIVCESLWKKIVAAGVTEITEADLKASGNVNEALADFYETALRQAVETAKVREGDLRRWVEFNLLTAAATRGTIFRGKETTGGMPNEVIDCLEEQHLLRAELRGGERWYELTHDRFIEPIRESNARWLAQRAGPEKERQNYEHSAAEWSNSGKSRMRLLRRKELRAAEKWKTEADAAELAISDTLAAFFDASRDAEREVARQWKLRGAIAAVALVAIAAVVVAWQFRAAGNRRLAAATAADEERLEANKLSGEGKSAEATTHLRQALSYAEKSGDDKRQLSILDDLTHCAGQLDEGAEIKTDALEKIVAITQRVGGQDSLKLIQPLNALGKILLERGRALWQEDQANAPSLELFERATESYKRACAILERRYGKDNPQLVESLDGLAHAYALDGKLDQAEIVYQRVPEIWEKHQGPQSKEAIDSLRNLADLYKERKKLPAAEEAYRRTVTILEKVYGKDSTVVAESLDHLVRFYRDCNRLPEVKETAARILQITEDNAGKKSREMIDPLKKLGDIQQETGDSKEANENYKNAISIAEETYGYESFELVELLKRVGDLEYKENQFGQAAEYYLRVATIREATDESDTPDNDVLQSLNALIEIEKKDHGVNSPQYIRALTMHARYLVDKNEDDGAIDDYKGVIELGEKLPNPDKLEIARNLIALGRLYSRKEHFADAQPLFEKASEIRNAKEEAERVSLADLMEASNEVAGCYQNQGYQNQGYFEKAENVYRQLLFKQEQSLGMNHYGLLDTLINSGRCLSTLEKLKDAERLFHRALRIQKAHASQVSSLADDFYLGEIQHDLGNIYRRLGNYSRAEELLKNAESKLQGQDSDLLVDTLDELGEVYADRGDFKTAIPYLEEEVKMQRRLYGEKNESERAKVYSGLHNLGMNLYRAGRFTEVEPLYKEALELSEKILGPESLDIVTQIRNKGWLYYDLGRFDEAEPLADRALASAEKDQQNHPTHVADALDLKAKLLAVQGKFKDAETDLQRSVKLRRDWLEEDHVDVSDSLLRLANLYRDTKRFAESEPLYQNALDIRSAHFSSQSAPIAEVLHDRALLYIQQEKYSKAEPLLTRALAIREKAFRDDCPFIGRTLWGLADVYAHQNQSDRAKLFYDRAVQIFRKSLPADHPDTAAVLEAYANVCKSTHADDKAAQLESEAKQIRAVREQHRTGKSPEQTLSPTPPIPTQAEQPN
jgi:tetratricopeptide (TPR) repeat protein